VAAGVTEAVVEEDGVRVIVGDTLEVVDAVGVTVALLVDVKVADGERVGVADGTIGAFSTAYIVVPAFAVARSVNPAPMLELSSWLVSYRHRPLAVDSEVEKYSTYTPPSRRPDRPRTPTTVDDGFRLDAPVPKTLVDHVSVAPPAPAAVNLYRPPPAPVVSEPMYMTVSFATTNAPMAVTSVPATCTLCVCVDNVGMRGVLW